MIILWFLAGGVAELVNTFLRQRSLRLVDRRSPRRSVWIVSAGFGLRLVWMALVLTLALLHRPVYGLAAFAGYWVFRWGIILWLIRR